MNRKRQQAEVIFQLGTLFGPLLRVAENPTIHNDLQKQQVAARFFAEHQTMLGRIGGFCAGSKDQHYLIQSKRASNAILSLVTAATESGDGPAELFKLAFDVRQKVIEAILEVPVDADSTIHSATTPFSVYCLVKDLCSTASKHIVWMDRYFDHRIFHRYFNDVPKRTAITLVTWPKGSCNGKKEINRYEAFADVSKTFAIERGQAGYRLITNEKFHDRWLQCDDRLFQLGGSIKDIGNGNTFTIAALDTTPQNLTELEEPIKTGTEVFGPNQPVHQ